MKKILFKVFIKLIYLAPPNLACMLNNIRQKIMNRDIKFYFDNEKKLYKVVENNFTMFFYDKMRGMNTYSYGIINRARSLAKTYFLDKIEFKKRDYVIDCGANYGDIFNFFDKDLEINYVSFEPSPKEFNCLKMNCPNQKNNEYALDNVVGKKTFFLKTDTGDSSLIEPAGGFNEKIKISTITLDEYIAKNNIKEIKLLKIEAEGNEPEVLQGSKNSLKLIKFIAIDGGPERGLKKETTIEFAKDYLVKSNFEMIHFNSSKNEVKGLFKNIS